MRELEVIDRLCRIHRTLLAYYERNITMPRGVKRVNNGPVDVPTTPSAQAQAEAAMPEVPVNKAYRSQGKDTPAIPDRPFGPGADYARKAWHTRLFDPANGATYQLAVTDVELEIFQHMVDQACEQGLVPCTSPDAPKQVQSSVAANPLDEATEAQRNFLKRLRSDAWDDPDLTKREASEMIEELTATARKRTYARR